MLDKTIPYAEFYMKRPGNLPVADYPLPEGYRFVNYCPGDENSWGKIETSVLEFPDEKSARNYFDQTFLPEQNELKRRMWFVENEKGEKVATCTAWWTIINGMRHPLFHWLAVMPKAQGKGLAKALSSKVTSVFQELDGAQPIYLHTQTWSHRAVNIYQKLDYQIIPENIDGTVNQDYTKALQILAAYQTN